MKTLKRRIFSMFLVLCMAAPLLPTNVWAAEGDITVTSKSLDVPLFNKQTYLNSAFKEETLYGLQNTKQMNAGKGFELFSTKGCKTQPAQNFYDNFGITLEHGSDFGWWVAHYKWDTNSAPVFRELMQQSELSVEVSAIMRYDEHYFIFRHGMAKDHTYIAIRNASQTEENGYIKFVMTPEDNDGAMKRYGNNSWTALPYLENDSELRLRLNHTNCMCGASKLVNGTVAFADTTGPAPPQVTMTTSGGDGRYFNSGTIDITLTFDEYIRLANAATSIPQEDALRYGLNLLAYDRRTNTSTTLTAELTEIGEKTMHFQYTIPEDEDMDVVISGVSADQPFFDNADMYMYTSNGAYESFPSFNLQTSLVCDLAGNRLNDQWNANIVFPEDQQFYIDTIAPEYASTALQGSMISSGTTPGDPEEGAWPDGADRSQVFAGVGDWLQMQVYFDEELVLQDPTQVEVVLNVNDEYGNPVTVRGTEAASVRNGVDARIPVTMLTTEQFTIEEDWTPAEPGRAIRAIEIRLLAGATDLCGNAFSSNYIAVGDIPAQQEYLDVTPPTLETMDAANGDGVYELTLDGNGAARFAFRVTDQADERIDENYRQAHISGSDAVGDDPDSEESGLFTLDGVNGSGTRIPFEYYVSALPDPTIAEDGWKTGYAGTAIRFTQVQDGTYVFIRPARNQEEEYIQLLEPTLTVRGLDHAGNKTEATYKLSQPDLFRDTVAPSVEANVVKMAENGSIGISGNVLAKDVGGLQEVYYKFEYLPSEDGTEPAYTPPTATDDTWTRVDLTEAESEYEYSFTIDPLMVEGGNNYYYGFLTVCVKDTSGNETIQTFTGLADLGTSSFDINIPNGVSDDPISISRLDKEEALKLGARERDILFTDSAGRIAGYPDEYSWNETTYGSLFVYLEPQTYLTNYSTLRPMALVIDDLIDDGSGNPVSREGVVGGAENERIDDLFGSLSSIDTSPWVSSMDPQAETGENQIYFRGMLANFAQKWDQTPSYNDVLSENRNQLFVRTHDFPETVDAAEYHANYPVWAQELAEAYQNYYGELKLYTINAPVANFYGSNGSGSGTGQQEGQNIEFLEYNIRSDDEYPWVIQEYTIKRAAVADGDTNPVHAVELGAPFMNDGTQMALSGDGEYYREDLTALHSLSGVRIPFDISNARIPGWGVDDLDFANSYMQFYVDGDPYGDPIPLTPNSAGQVFSFPDDLVYDCTSTYDARVTLTAKVSGHTDEYSVMQPIKFCTMIVEPTMNHLYVTLGDSYDQSYHTYLTETLINDSNIDSIVIHEEIVSQLSEWDDNYVKTNHSYRMTGDSYVKNMTGNTEVCDSDINKVIYLWNAAAPDKKWEMIDRQTCNFVLVNSTEEILSMEDDYNYVPVPIIKGQRNIICIQGAAQYMNDVGSDYYELGGEVIQIPVTLISGQLPEASLQAEPSDRTTQAAEFTADINSLYGVKSLWIQYGLLEENESGYIDYGYMMQVMLDEENRLCMAETVPVPSSGPTESAEPSEPEIVMGERLTTPMNGDYTFLAIDSYGGVAVAETTVDNIDSIAPVMSVNESTAADGSYSLDLTMTEENPAAAPENLTLYLSAENPNVPTAAVDPNEDETEPETEPFTMIAWSEAPYMKYGSAASATGIYAMEAEYSGDETGHTLRATIEGAIPESGTLWAWTTDEAGNRSEPVQLFSDAEFAAPKFESAEKDPNGGVILNFTSGVMLSEPTSGTPDTAYSRVKSGVPIYRDGTHTITYYDFFGNVYTEQITVAVDGDFSAASVSFSETAPTRNDVTVTVASTDENHLLQLGDCTVTDLAGTPMDTSLYAVEPGADGESVRILMRENGIVSVGMIYGEQTSTKTIRVDNIDREVNARLVWSYADGMDHEPNTDVDGAVTVRAVSADGSETIVGVNGALTYTFTEGAAGQSYTFEYRDSAGNVGSIVAELPVNIVSYAPEALSFEMEIYLMQRGALSPAGSYGYSGEGDTYSFENMPASMENRLNIQANRSDAEALILPEGTSADSVDENTQSADIDGVTLSGKSVIITQNVAFTLALRSGSEVIVLPVSVTNISKLEEVGLIYATLDRYSRRVYFDPKGQSLTLTNQTGIAQETEYSQYQGYYYHDFTSNGSFTFYYEDAAGNTGSIAASVMDLVTGQVEPENLALPIRWWPYKIQDAEGTNQSQLTDSAVNYDVTAQVKYNMNITDAALYYNNGSGDAGDPIPANVASLNVSLDTVDVTYHENADAVLVVVGENGTGHTLPIGAVSIIDKTPPVVEHNYTAGDMRQSVEIAFTPQEEVLCDNISSAQYYSPENPMRTTVTANGTYNYTFRDRAGNQTTLTIEVTDIDTTAPQLRFKLSESGVEYGSWEALSAENDVTNVTSIYLLSDESAVCQFQGQNTPLNQGEWTSLQINLNGVYGMTVTDGAGNAAVLSLSGILVPDETAPTLWITPSRISVRIGISDEELTAALMEGVSASDNNTAAEEIVIEADRTELVTTQKGVYEVSYTARDGSGNVGTATRSVTVIGEDDLTLTVNGNLTTSMGTMVLNTGSVNFAVGNLPEMNGIFEPYSIYVKKGFLTMGQMKNNANKVFDNQTELYGSGYYTVYVVAQNRRQYLTYLYIEQ